MSLDLINSDKLDEDFASFTLVSRGNIKRNRPHPRVDLIPTELPSGDRLEDSFGGSANYRPVSEMNSFENGAVPDITSVGDTDYETTPYGYTLNEDYYNISGNRKKRKERRKKAKEDFNKKVGDIKDKLKKGIDSKLGGGKAVHALNKTNPLFITMRGSMLSIIDLNLVGIATALSEMKEDSDGAEDWKKILQKWWMWGGDRSKFEKAVNKGKNKKPAFKALIEKGKKGSNFNGGYYDVEGEGLDKAGNSIIIASSLLGIATPILASFTATAPVAVWTGSASGGFGSMGSIFKSYAKKKGVDENKLNAVPTTPDLPNAPIPNDDSTLEKIAKIIALTDDNGDVDKKLMSEVGLNEQLEESDNILGIPKPAFWIGVGVIALVGGYFVYKKFIKK